MCVRKEELKTFLELKTFKKDQQQVGENTMRDQLELNLQKHREAVL